MCGKTQQRPPAAMKQCGGAEAVGDPSDVVSASATCEILKATSVSPVIRIFLKGSGV